DFWAGEGRCHTTDNAPTTSKSDNRPCPFWRPANVTFAVRIVEIRQILRQLRNHPMTDTPRQLSRVAGVPRLRLPIWKAAAAQFFQGKKDPSRDEQRNNGKKTKVALLRELVATDPKVKSWLIQFAADLRARGAREM